MKSIASAVRAEDFRLELSMVDVIDHVNVTVMKTSQRLQRTDAATRAAAATTHPQKTRGTTVRTTRRRLSAPRTLDVISSNTNSVSIQFLTCRNKSTNGNTNKNEELTRNL